MTTRGEQPECSMSAGAVAYNYLKDDRDGESIVPGTEPPLLHHRSLKV